MKTLKEPCGYCNGTGIDASGEACRGCWNDIPKPKCRECGCTDLDCSQCIEKTGSPCYWIRDDLCSACLPPDVKDIMKEVAILDTQILN